MMVHGVGVLLLTSVGGYWVLERSATHKGQLKQLGQVLGGLIIVVSLIGIACQVVHVIMCDGAYGMFGKMGKGGWCPYTSKRFPTDAGPQP